MKKKVQLVRKRKLSGRVCVYTTKFSINQIKVLKKLNNLKYMLLNEAIKQPCKCIVRVRTFKEQSQK